MRSFGVCGRKPNERSQIPSSAVQQFSSSAVQQFSSSAVQQFSTTVMVLFCLTLSAFSQGPGPYPTPAPTHISKASGSWNDIATWIVVAPTTHPIPLFPSDTIHIKAGHTVTLDIPTDCAKTIIVDGTLIIGNTLQTWCFQLLYIRNGGKLKVGTFAAPFTGNLNISLEEDPSTTPPTPGRFFVDSGGDVKMWGNQNSQLSHGKLSESLLTGQTRIRTVGNPRWTVGSKIVVASTDYDTNLAEEFTITSVTNLTAPTRVEYGIDHPAVYQHFVGTLHAGPPKSMTIAAEVGLLSRNITIQGPTVPTTAKWGGFIRFGENPAPGTPRTDHVPTAPAPKVNINWVEFTGLGNRLVEGEYPIHFHYGGAMTVGRIGASSFHHNYNRSIVVHHTTDVQLIDNVSYHTYGHAFFFASGLEKGCTLTGNLGLSTLAAEENIVDPKDPTGQKILLRLDEEDDVPATFWIKTMDCTVNNNISAGSEGAGFWVDNPHEVFTYQTIVPDVTNPAGTQGGFPSPVPVPTALSTPAVWSFNGNLAHSSGTNGYYADDAVILWGDASNHALKVDGFTAYKCGQYGIFSRNFGHVLWENSRIADCQGALYTASTAFPGSDGEAITTFKNTLVIGDSVNTGTAASWSTEEALVGRSLPLPQFKLAPNRALWGFELYDGLAIVDDIEFVNFNNVPTGSGGTRMATAIINLISDVGYNADPRNMMIGATFTNVPTNNRLFFRTASVLGNANNHIVLWNPDGSITGFGTPGQSGPAGYITGDQPALLHTGASKTGTPGVDDAIWNAAWNAWMVPDLPRSATETGRGIVQMLFRDQNKTHFFDTAGIPAFMRLTRVISGGGTGPSIESHHIFDGSEFFANNYPFNVKQGEVYEVTPPTPTAGPGTPIDFENFDIIMRFCRPGDWLTLKIPMGIPPSSNRTFDPKNNGSSNDVLRFFLHQRMDCLDYSGQCDPSKKQQVLGNFRDPTATPPIEYCKLPRQLPIATLSNSLSPFNGHTVPTSPLLTELGMLPVVTAPVASGAVNSAPYGLAWHFAQGTAVSSGNPGTQSYLYLRIALINYGSGGPYDGISLPAGAWFIPTGFLPGVDVMFEGGSVLVRVQDI